MIIPFALVTALIQSGRAIGAAPRQPDAASVPADFYMHTPRLSVTVDGVGKKMILDTGSDRTSAACCEGRAGSRVGGDDQAGYLDRQATGCQ